MKTIVLAVCGWVMLTGGVCAAEQTEIPEPLPIPSPELRVSPEVASVLRAANAQATPQNSIASLEAYHGKPDAIIFLALAQAHHRRLPFPNDGAERAAALAAYLHALELDPSQHGAALGIAQLAAEAGDWTKAMSWCARAVDARSAPAAELSFYGHVAYENHDWQLVSALATTGVMRFPADESFRKLLLGELLRSGQFEQAATIAEDLVTRHDDDASLWRQLAWAKQQKGDGAESLLALEAATMAAPGDRDLLRHLVEAQAAQGLPRTAMASVQKLLAIPAPGAETHDVPTVLLAVRIALSAGDLIQAKDWLQSLPADPKNRDMQILAARIAIQQGDLPHANTALSTLISAGEHDPMILAWAGQVAEQIRDLPRAEALYMEASIGAGPAAEAALLHLAALQLKQHRLADARGSVSTYLAKHPGDEPALALQRAIMLTK